MSRKAAVEPKWNFYLDTNKSTGIQYVQTSYNIWVPEKKQPRLGGKAYVVGSSLTVPSALRRLSWSVSRNTLGKSSITLKINWLIVRVI